MIQKTGRIENIRIRILISNHPTIAIKKKRMEHTANPTRNVKINCSNKEDFSGFRSLKTPQTLQPVVVMKRVRIKK
jgi:hypothetical protein